MRLLEEDRVDVEDLAAMSRFARERVRADARATLVPGRMPRIPLGTEMSCEVSDLPIRASLEGEAWPICNPMRRSYVTSLRRIAAILEGEALEISDAADLSAIISMFERIIWRDQSDWYELEAMLDFPHPLVCRRVEGSLRNARASLFCDAESSFEGAVGTLRQWFTSKWLTAVADRIESLPASLDPIEVLPSARHAAALAPVRCAHGRSRGSWLIHNSMRPTYVRSLRGVAEAIMGETFFPTDVESLVGVKTMLNRVVMQHGEDWVEIKEVLGFPHPSWCRHVAKVLKELVRSLSNGSVSGDRLWEVRGLLDPAMLSSAADCMAAIPGPTVREVDLGENASFEPVTVPPQDSVARKSREPDGARDAGRGHRGSWPIRNPMRARYVVSLRRVAKVLTTGEFLMTDADHLSEVKGMFNRIVRRDQPDWREVNELLGYPSPKWCRLAADALGDLAHSLRSGDVPTDEVSAVRGLLDPEHLSRSADRIAVLPVALGEGDKP